MSRVIFSEIEFANIFSFGQVKQKVKLNRPGLTFIIGENLDEGGSSGAGKSSIISAISFCLFDKVPIKVSKGGLINDINSAHKDANLYVSMSIIVDNDTWRITRQRGALDILKLEQNGVDVTPAGTGPFNAKIEELVGFSYNLFSQIVLFNGNARPFLDLDASDQRDLIEELLKITMLSRKAEAIKKLGTQTESDIKLQDALILQQKAQLERYEQQLAEAEKRVTTWEAKHAADLVQAQADIDRINAVDFNLEEELHLAINRLSEEIAPITHLVLDRQHEITLLQSKTSPTASQVLVVKAEQAAIRAKTCPAVAKREQLQTERRRVQAETSPAFTERKLKEAEQAQLKTKSEALSKEITHLQSNNCPYCLQRYEGSMAKLDLSLRDHEALLNKLVDLEQEVVNLRQAEDAFELNKQTRLIELTEQEAALAKEISEFNEGIIAELCVIDDKLFALADEERKFNAEQQRAIERVKAEQEELNRQISAKKVEQQEIRDALTYKTYVEHNKAQQLASTYAERLEKLKLETNPHVSALDGLLASPVVVVTDELDRLKNLREHQKILVKLLTDKNSYIRKALISKTLPFLNKQIAHYTEAMGLPHIVKFEADMKCDITKQGRQTSHGNLSNGEKKRLNFALSLSFRDVLTHLHARLDFMSTDEIDGGSLDEQSVNYIISLIKRKAWTDKMSVFIISHRPEFEGKCDYNLTVRKERGFSTLIEEVA